MVIRDNDLQHKFAEWKDDEASWVKRACCITFVRLGKHKKYHDVIEDISDTVVKDSYRFVQLGNGWMLRNMSVVDPDRVIRIIKQNKRYMSKEGVRYAIEKFDPDLRKELRDYIPQAIK